MKLPHLLLLILLLTPSTLSAPIPGELPTTSLTDSVRSFESAFTELDDKIQAAAEEHKAFGRREKWITGVAAVLTTVGTGGYIVSSAVPEAKRQQQAAALRRLRVAVARADARAAGQRARVKRSAAEALERAVEDDAESFKSALSRTPSMRIGDFDDTPHPAPAAQLTRSHSLPAPSTNPQSNTDRLLQDNLDTHLRLSALETALLDVRRHQHEQMSKLSPFAKFMVGFAFLNAAGAVVSAELSAQGAIESNRGMGPLPDVRNLDRGTCEQYARKVDGVDCAQARGKGVQG